MYNLPIRREDFLWAFSMMCQIHRVPLLPNVVIQQFVPPYTLSSFRLAAREGGFSVGQSAVSGQEIGRVALPCLAVLKPEGGPVTGGEGPATGVHGIAMVVSADEKWVTLVDAGSSSPTTLSIEEFDRRFARQVLLIAPEKQPRPQSETEAEKKSGLRWRVTDWFKPLVSGLRSSGLG